MRIAAGILMVIAGVGAMVGASLAVGVMFVFGFLSIALVGLLTVLALALMVMAFIGAHCTFTRRRFKLALAGAICAAVAIPFLPGLLATIFLALTEREFQQGIMEGDRVREELDGSAQTGPRT